MNNDPDAFAAFFFLPLLLLLLLLDFFPFSLCYLQPFLLLLLLERLQWPFIAMDVDVDFFDGVCFCYDDRQLLVLEMLLIQSLPAFFFDAAAAAASPSIICSFLSTVRITVE